MTPLTPVFLSRYDGHAVLANSLALKMAGVTKETPDPAGGVIVRDPQSGEPTGILKDEAQESGREGDSAALAGRDGGGITGRAPGGRARRSDVRPRHYRGRRVVERELHG